MTLGAQTDVVNGQRFNMPTAYTYRPPSYGQQTTAVPVVAPTIPPMVGGASNGHPAVASHINGFGTSDNNGMVAAIAGAHPHSLKVSPVWWAVAALLVGLWLLNAVHWRETVLESGDGAVQVGKAEASAHESV